MKCKVLLMKNLKPNEESIEVECKEVKIVDGFLKIYYENGNEEGLALSFVCKYDLIK